MTNNAVYNLLEQYAAEGYQFFRKSSMSGKSTAYHVTQRDKIKSLCGQADASHQPVKKKRERTEITLETSIDELEEIAGTAELCSRCQKLWKKEQSSKGDDKI